MVDLLELQQRRDALIQAFGQSPVVFTQVVAPVSGFHLLFRASSYAPDIDDTAFCHYLAKEYQVMTTPGTVFMGLPGWMGLLLTASSEMVDFTCRQITEFGQEFTPESQPNPFSIAAPQNSNT